MRDATQIAKASRASRGRSRVRQGVYYRTTIPSWPVCSGYVERLEFSGETVVATNAASRIVQYAPHEGGESAQAPHIGAHTSIEEWQRLSMNKR